MPTSTNAKRPSSEDRLDLIFHALSDRTRRALLARLLRGPAMVTDLAEPFRMSLPAVSKHLRVLESARLIVRAVDGRVHRCSLAPHAMRQAEQWLEGHRAFWNSTLNSLAQYVETEKRPNKL